VLVHPANILECIALGIDMFDCVMPTRNARNGMLFTTQGIINIKNKKWENDFSPIDEQLGGYVSTHHSKAYLRHLFQANEILSAQIASIHNLTFYLWLVNTARTAIIDGSFYGWKKQIIPVLMQKL
jgi:queuine tRNA-ribosyltransferase